MTDTQDPNRRDQIKTTLSEWGDAVKTDLESLDIADNVKAELATRLDQKLDELGAKLTQ